MNDSTSRTADELIAALTEIMINYRRNSGETSLHAVQPITSELSDMTEILSNRPTKAISPPRHLPWANMANEVEKGKSMGFQMSPTLHAKMRWVTNHVPKMSMQRIVKAGAEAEADRLIALYFSPD